MTFWMARQVPRRFVFEITVFKGPDGVSADWVVEMMGFGRNSKGLPQPLDQGK